MSEEPPGLMVICEKVMEGCFRKKNFAFFLRFLF